MCRGEGMTGSPAPGLPAPNQHWRTTTNNLPHLVGGHSMRRAGPASRPEPLRGRPCGPSLDPGPYLSTPKTSRRAGKTARTRALDGHHSFRDDPLATAVSAWSCSASRWCWPRAEVHRQRYCVSSWCAVRSNRGWQGNRRGRHDRSGAARRTLAHNAARPPRVPRRNVDLDVGLRHPAPVLPNSSPRTEDNTRGQTPGRRQS